VKITVFILNYAKI